MHAMRKGQIGFRGLLAATLLWGSCVLPAQAEIDAEPSGEEMVADALVARPLGIAATALGAAAFVVSLPFSLLGGNVDRAANNLVLEPAREAFVRCLGCKRSGRADAEYREPAKSGY